MSLEWPAPADALARSADTPSACFHCGETVDAPGRWHIEFEGVKRPVCCPGCRAASATIIEAGLGAYYRHRTAAAVAPAAPASPLAEQPDALAVYDEPEIRDRYVHPPQDAADTSDRLIDLTIEGMRCGACVWLLERALLDTPGVSAASVNLSTERAQLRFDPQRIALSGLLHRIGSLGYRALPYDAAAREVFIRQQSRALLQRLFLAGLASMQVMMYALPSYLAPEGIEPQYRELLHWASLVLTLPVLLYAASPFLQGAWRGLKAARPGMDLPVAIGLLSAFVASVHSTVTGSGEVYYDSVSMFVFLLLGARYLEWSARRRAMRVLDTIGHATPETARRLDAEERVELIPAVRLARGDRIRVHAGERVPVDALLCSGTTAIDQSLLTGESLPITVKPGDPIPGGALLAGSPVTLEVERPQSASTLSMIEQLIERAAAEKPRLVSLADRVATVFVCLLLVLAALVGVLWWHIDPHRAGGIVIAVLVVSCPCALSLATPAALAAATGRLLRARVLITRGHALETLARVTDVVFDKTGTLTEGQPSVTAVHTTEGVSPSALLALADRLERGSAHPFALALHAARSRADIPACTLPAPTDPLARRLIAEAGSCCRAGPLSLESGAAAAGSVHPAPGASRLGEARHVPGSGIVASLYSGRAPAAELRLGSALWCGIEEPAGSDRDTSRDAPDSHSRIYLSLQRAGCRVSLGRIELADPLRAEAPEVISALKRRGYRVHLLSGDHVAAARQVGLQLGFDSIQGEATPQSKYRQILAWQARGARVLMIGDGMNDAPVLAAADVSLAVKQASSLARSAADCLSLAPGLTAVPTLIGVARQTRRIVRQNLAWALGYNLTAIPLAAIGWVPPWLAAIGMATSSLLVSANASRLLRQRHARRG